jgi:hypothetical protein
MISQFIIAYLKISNIVNKILFIHTTVKKLISFIYEFIMDFE